MLNKASIFVGLMLLCCSPVGAQTAQPRPLADLQLEFVNTRYQAYFHYGINSYDDSTAGWGSGKANPKLWNPTGLDCDQWADVVLAAGMKGGWLTTKHHDGFCLWDTTATDPFQPGQEANYDVASSDNNVDVVKAFTDAFRKKGLKIGLYYSIWDFHYDIRSGMMTPAKEEYLLEQIRELLTNYGKIDYINFDAWQYWNDIPYFDEFEYYKVYNLVKSLQPECLIINHQYESNLAHSDVPFADASGGKFLFTKEYMRPTAGSDNLNRGWFFGPNAVSIRRSPEQIVDNLNQYNSLNSVYILNVSPNKVGLIPEECVETLKAAAEIWVRPADIKKPGENWGHSYDVSKNLAFMKPVKQSSIDFSVRDKRALPMPEIAIDGVTEGNYNLEQVSRTRRAMDPEHRETGPWWQVDLLDERDIDEVRIYFRTDPGGPKKNSYSVIFMDEHSQIVSSKSIQREYPTASMSVPAEGVRARHVRVRLNGKDQLALAEVIVLGSDEKK
ncbi:alpha-L-fucosidase 1 [Rhodopirellula baltica SH28]|uniref:alpha-L-fucosidase n=1 Tax=Rhodopirellula baltica SH28 TaxID=993517 RepID=K5E6A8_RHOBT|nr:alpha-L-fucosidase [Rhodopirellula baltica]EKK01296.1 alpha-L-fucosidase 1 [Rhodopirellula baltica SH28]